MNPHRTPGTASDPSTSQPATPVVVLFNRTERFIEGPRSLGSARFWGPGTTEIPEDVWANLEKDFDAYASRSSASERRKPVRKLVHPVKALIDEGYIEVRKGSAKLRPAPTEAELAALSDKQLETMQHQKDLEASWTEGVAAEIYRRASQKKGGRRGGRDN